MSHSSLNNGEAIALRDWLISHGWDDLFLDLDPERGLKAGQRWPIALKQAAERCELVIFLISPAWAASKWCVAEFLLARSLNKRIFGVIIVPTPFADLPAEMTAEWQLVDLSAGAREHRVTVTVPPGDKTATVSLSNDGLHRLRIGLMQAGLEARYFAWPPETDPERAPYRGLKPLEGEDAGIFFGRDGPIVVGLDLLRGLREAAPPRLAVILGASGAGKSSFMRAGLWPRLSREDQHFLPLRVIRPERAVLTGETGLIASLEATMNKEGLARTSTEIRTAVAAGACGLAQLLASFVHSRTPTSDGSELRKPPTLIFCIDQAEELFLPDGAQEARAFLGLLRHLTAQHTPASIVLFTIRSDEYERLQTAEDLQGLRQHILSLPPMPQGAYVDVIKGPARRLEGSKRPLKIEEPLVDALLSDVESGGAKDALPLLAFTLERLYREHGGDGDLKLSKYEELGRIKGSIEAAVERALRAADGNPSVPKDRDARLALLRRALIPWLAGIDPESGFPRRRVARRSEIPADARPLVELLVEQRLLATDLGKDGESTVEPAHEALLRQWGLLESWLKEDTVFLGVLDGVQRASRDWADNGKSAAWLTHVTGRLEAADRLRDRPDLAALLEPRDLEYLAACRKMETTARSRKHRVQAFIYMLLVGIIAGLVGWVNQAYLKEQTNWYWTMRPYMLTSVRPFALTPESERALRPLATFHECAKDCPEMVVVPAGTFIMGSPTSEKGRYDNEGPQHEVTIPMPFAVSKFPVTFDDWDICVAVGGCPQVSQSGFGRGRKPVVNLTWDEAKQYVAWFSQMTGQPYRLLSEAEWEYTARAGTATVYPWGDEIGKGNANCSGCGSLWDGKETSPVGSFKPNAFGLFDMHGNVFQWVEDCYHESYDGAPTDGSPRTSANCSRRIMRGGSWFYSPGYLRSAYRIWYANDNRRSGNGFRIARTLSFVFPFGYPH